MTTTNVDEDIKPAAPGPEAPGKADGRLRSLAELYEDLARAIQQSCYVKGLKPAQWSALRFFARANLGARTVTGLANSMMATKGSASQTVQALRRRKMIEVVRDPDDLRIARISLTRKGMVLLEHDPLLPLVNVFDRLPADKVLNAAELAEAMLRALFASGADAPVREKQSARPAKSDPT